MTVHKFEEAGLGTAPFRLVGFEVRRSTGQPDANGRIVGYAGQPLGSCAYCGTGIADCYVIRSADGKTFDVGCVCVNKTDDAGLVDTVKRKANEIKTARRHEKEAVRIAATVKALESVELRTALASQPHPQAWAKDQGLTLLDWAEWMMANSGNSGRIRVARVVFEQITKGDD